MRLYDQSKSENAAGLISNATDRSRPSSQWAGRVNYSEKRGSERYEINVPATIIVISRGLRVGKLIKCKVLNISEEGALIRAEYPMMDTEFYLEMNHELGTLRLCSVVRRLDGEIGVRFIKPI